MRKKVAVLVLTGSLALTVNGFALQGTSDFAVEAELTTRQKESK